MRASAKATARVLCFTVLIAGCTTTGGRDGASQTLAEKRMREQAATFNQTIAEGAALGCVAGLVLGALVSSRGDGQRGQGMAIGCTAGAAVGGATGYYVADKQEQYASTEERLAAMTTDLRADNQRLADLIDASHQVLVADRATLRRLEKQLAEGVITRDKTRQQLAAVDDNTRYLEQTVASLKKKQQEYAMARARSQGSAQAMDAMDAEIARLERQIAALAKDLDALILQRQAFRVSAKVGG